MQIEWPSQMRRSEFRDMNNRCVVNSVTIVSFLCARSRCRLHDKCALITITCATGRRRDLLTSVCVWLTLMTVHLSLCVASEITQFG